MSRNAFEDAQSALEADKRKLDENLAWIAQCNKKLDDYIELKQTKEELLQKDKNNVKVLYASWALFAIINIVLMPIAKELFQIPSILTAMISILPLWVALYWLMKMSLLSEKRLKLFDKEHKTLDEIIVLRIRLVEWLTWDVTEINRKLKVIFWTNERVSTFLGN